MNRTSVLQFVVMNHESAINDRENWRRTAAAVIGLHDDKEAVLQTFAKHESELNAVFQASRLLIEFALCECPVDSGRDPGLRDMSRLMAKVLMVPGIGGWSDAIRWDAMEPRVRITALGDIHADVTFHVSTAAGICTGAAAQKCTTGSVVACPCSPWEGPARGATRPRRGWRRPARGRGLWAHGDKRGVIRTVAGVVTGSA